MYTIVTRHFPQHMAGNDYDDDKLLAFATLLSLCFQQCVIRNVSTVTLASNFRSLLAKLTL